MNQKDYFKDMYKDFFGIEEIPKIEVKTKEETIANRDEIMKQLFDEINESYLDEESKSLLKQMIEYARKYNEGIEKNYIPFRVLFRFQNKELEQEMIDILSKGMNAFSYVDKKEMKEVSFYDKSIPMDDLYQKYGILVWKDIKGIELKDTADKKLLFHDFCTALEEYSHRLSILSVHSKEETRISNICGEATLNTGQEEIRRCFRMFLRRKTRYSTSRVRITRSTITDSAERVNSALWSRVKII